MNEVPDQGAGLRPAAAPPPGASAGALIRRAREDAGVHVAALAVALKVPVRRLEALETDRHDLLPDMVFARALARSVCRHLKVNPEPVLALLPERQTQPLSVEGRINEPFRPHHQPAGSGRLPALSRPAVWAGVLLVVATAVVYLLPGWVGAPAEPPAAGAVDPAAPDSLPVLPGLPAPAPAPLAPEAPAARGADAMPELQLQSAPALAPAPSR